MPRVYILCGLPFAGKTTLAKALIQHLDLVRVSIDEINSVRGLGLNNSAIAPADWDNTYAESYRQLALYLRIGYSVVYDAANFSRSERARARTIADQNGSDARVIYVTTPATIVRQRWLENRITHIRNDIRDDYFEIGLSSFEPPTEDEQVLLHNNEQDVEDWIEQNSLVFRCKG